MVVKSKRNRKRKAKTQRPNPFRAFGAALKVDWNECSGCG
jgi:hypothetical protein